MRAWSGRCFSGGAVLVALALGSGGCTGAVVDESRDEEDGASEDELVGEDGEGASEDGECSPGAWIPCDNFDGYQICEETPDGNRWSECIDPCAVDCSTPLVLSFRNERVTFVHEMAGSFDLTGAGQSVATDWPSAATPWLALDRDGNGAIDGGGELFGSATRLAGGRHASDGFEALGELDTDGDGAITAGDAAFGRLLVWRDVDANRASDPSELRSAADAGLVLISLRDWASPRCDERGNCEIERAEMRFVDAAGRQQIGAVIDVHVRRR